VLPIIDLVVIVSVTVAEFLGLFLDAGGQLNQLARVDKWRQHYPLLKSSRTRCLSFNNFLTTAIVTIHRDSSRLRLLLGHFRRADSKILFKGLRAQLAQRQLGANRGLGFLGKALLLAARILEGGREARVLRDDIGTGQGSWLASGQCEVLVVVFHIVAVTLIPDIVLKARVLKRQTLPIERLFTSVIDKMLLLLPVLVWGFLPLLFEFLREWIPARAVAALFIG